MWINKFIFNKFFYFCLIVDFSLDRGLIDLEDGLRFVFIEVEFVGVGCNRRLKYMNIVYLYFINFVVKINFFYFFNFIW